MNFRTMAFAALATAAFGTSAVSFAQTAPGPQGTPPPPPVPSTSSTPLISTSPEPSAAPSAEAIPGTTPTPPPEPLPVLSPSPAASQSAGPQGRHRGGRRGGATPAPEASASETPEPPQFSTLDGVWEVALQPLNGARAKYSHLYITQQGNTLTGTWRRGDVKKPMPFTGTFDGRLFKLTVTNGTKTELLSGYEENYMDMVGLYTNGDPKDSGTPFTAGHRKSAKERERDEQKIGPQAEPSGKPPIH